MISALRSLYRGDNRFDILGRSRFWLLFSTGLIVFAILGIVVRGLNYGIEFEGGSVWKVPVASDVGDGTVRAAVEGTGIVVPNIVFVREAGQRYAEVRSRTSDPAVVSVVRTKLLTLPGASEADTRVDSVGPSWGSEISRKAVQALVIFLVLVTIYLAFRFEPKMAIAALSALAHDVIVTIGIYAWTGFQVVPASVIALLTILGYSLYDTVVVFDKLKEVTGLAAAGGRQTYTETVNDGLNVVLMRSLNTSIATLIPVGALLLVGLFNPAAETLKDFALALFIGLLSGAYSSIFFATPILVLLKEREPANIALRRRLETRSGRDARQPAMATSARSQSVSRPARPPRRPDPMRDDPGAADEIEEELILADELDAEVEAIAPAPAERPARAGQPVRKPPPRPNAPRPRGSRPSHGKRKKRR